MQLPINTLFVTRKLFSCPGGMLFNWLTDTTVVAADGATGAAWIGIADAAAICACTGIGATPLFTRSVGLGGGVIVGEGGGVVGGDVGDVEYMDAKSMDPAFDRNATF